MRLPTTAYMLIGIILGLLLVSAAFIPALVNSGTPDSTGGDDGGGSGGDDSGGGDTPPTPTPAYDPNNYYKATGMVRITTDRDGNVIADFLQVTVVRYTPAPIKLPEFPALRWTEADYRVKVQFFDIHGRLVAEKTVWDDLIPYGTFRTVSFELDMEHWTGGTLRLVVERMDGRWYIGDTENIVYKGDDL